MRSSIALVAPVVRLAWRLGLLTALAGCHEARVEAPPEAPPPPAPTVKAPPPPAAVAPAPAPKARRPLPEVEGTQLKLPGPVVFEEGSSKLKEESDEILFIVKEYLEAKPEVTRLRVEGHTDSNGNATANQALSERRSVAVAQWLIGHGIDCRRLLAVGFGATRPIADNKTPDGRAQNRRTAFHNAELKGTATAAGPLTGGGVSAGDACKP